MNEILIEGMLLGGAIFFAGALIVNWIERGHVRRDDEYQVGGIVTLKSGKRYVYKGNGGWKELELPLEKWD